MKMGKLQGCTVSQFPSFKVLKFRFFKSSEFQRFENFISCFLLDIDFISKIFKNLLNGSSALFGSTFQQNQNLKCPKIMRFPRILFLKKDSDLFRQLFEII